MSSCCGASPSWGGEVGGYWLACGHEHSCCVLLASRSYLPGPTLQNITAWRWSLLPNTSPQPLNAPRRFAPGPSCATTIISNVLPISTTAGDPELLPPAQFPGSIRGASATSHYSFFPRDFIPAGSSCTRPPEAAPRRQLRLASRAPLASRHCVLRAMPPQGRRPAHGPNSRPTSSHQRRQTPASPGDLVLTLPPLGA